ncbi:hypothetical protein [Amycolatopsis sulphurea]|uniref:hypothetical protein n=1 Tax=Amycolatopsis sulphurea TaxID=76022 RepID=UPI001145220B|nr:hypothetical protein [Amycolatopsis sulphurea]
MTNGVNRSERDRMRAAAIEYPAYGWGVLPGSVWNGRRYTLGHTPTRVDGLAPVMLSGQTLRTAREVWSWWSVAPYAALARAGEDFDVLTAPAELVTTVSTALELPGSAVRACPVMLAPDRRSAQLLIRAGSRLRWELRRARRDAAAGRRTGRVAATRPPLPLLPHRRARLLDVAECVPTTSPTAPPEAIHALPIPRYPAGSGRSALDPRPAQQAGTRASG